MFKLQFNLKVEFHVFITFVQAQTVTTTTSLYWYLNFVSPVTESTLSCPAVGAEWSKDHFFCIKAKKQLSFYVNFLFVLYIQQFNKLFYIFFIFLQRICLLKKKYVRDPISSRSPLLQKSIFFLKSTMVPNNLVPSTHTS